MPTADTLGRQGPWHFERYVNGVHMAEGVKITHAASEEEAIRKAAILCPKRMGTVLILRRNNAPALLACVRALKEIAEMTDPDDEDNYRADDREGCFDAVYETAAQALAALEAGE